MGAACTNKPAPINYGQDECKFCMMKIMDARFGAEIVTDKGKTFKYDSAECMLQDISREEHNVNSAQVLVTFIDVPNQLQNAFTSYYVVSKNIPSPMGGNLSSYATQQLASAIAEENQGAVYTWQEIISKDAVK